MLVLFRRVLYDFNNQSDFINLTEHKYLKKYFIKISNRLFQLRDSPGDTTSYTNILCVTYQETQHLIQIEYFDIIFK